MKDKYDNLLFRKIFACEAAGAIGNSMGEIMEGFTIEQRQEKWGYVTEMLPVVKREHRRDPANPGTNNPADFGLGHPLEYHAHTRIAGTTEDGEERHRLCSTAIIEKGGRINCMELATIFARDIKPECFGYLMGPQDQIIYYAIKAGVPPWEVGRYASWPGFYGTSKMIAPIGEVNAFFPANAAQDAFDVGRIKDVRGVPGNYALEVCAAYASAVAEALKPDATIDSTIETALACLSLSPRSDALEALTWAKNCDNIEEYGRKFQVKYDRKPVSNAVEIFSAALGIIYMAKGNPKDAILLGVNSGRDTDCRAHTAGSISGALSGPDSIPSNWIELVDAAMTVNPYTVSNRSIRETAEGLFNAAMNNIEKMRRVVTIADFYTK